MRSHSYEGRREHSELVFEDIKPEFWKVSKVLV